jgi:[CysO sulfur-carrier protein]-S-L-cysteine hydrolase
MRIDLPLAVETRFRSALREAGTREIGGMLFAEQLKPSHFSVIDFSLDAFSGSHAAFRRDPGSHQKALDEFFERTGRDFQRFNYLGEWHSHPSFSVRPSAQDLQTMMDIVQNHNLIVSFAVLLIVRLRLKFFVDHSVTIFARDQVPQQLHRLSRSRRKYGHAPAAASRCPSRPNAASQACCVASSSVHGRMSAPARASRA